MSMTDSESYCRGSPQAYRASKLGAETRTHPQRLRPVLPTVAVHQGRGALRITSLFISAMKQENRMWFSKTKTERHPNNSSERNATEPSLKASKSPIRSSAASVHHLPVGRVSELWRPGRPTRLWLLSSMARTAQCSKQNASEVIQKLPSSTEIPETVRGREL